MSVTVPGTIPAESLLAWCDARLVDDVVAVRHHPQTSTSLSAVLIERQLAATDEAEREHWAALVCLIDQQHAAPRTAPA